MSSKRDFDRAVEQWLDEGSHVTPPEVVNAVLLAVRSTPQERRSWWPAWRTNRMNTSAKLIAAAAAVLVVTIGGYQFLPGGSGSGGTNATPSPTPSLIARGNFMTTVSEAVELEAIAWGSSVTGRMTVSKEDYSFTVDLQCTRTTEDGLIMIGGVTTDTTGGGSALSPEGTWAAIVLKRGSPVEASTWSQRGGPMSEAASCLAYLDEQLLWERSTHRDGDLLEPVEGGTVELGP